MVGTPLTFARTPEALATQLSEHLPELIILDLTTSDWDYETFFSTLERHEPRGPVLGFTTHALARHTQPLHVRCQRVVTKETLTRELGSILKDGLAA